jgi:CRP-like cAMP-binding protein
MITRQDLKQIVMLTHLTDSMLDSLAEIIDVLRFDRDEVIFRAKEPSERFYMLKRGHILLEQRISDQVTAFMGAIKPGYSFGWSAMIENEIYTVDAVCKEPSEVYSFKSDKIRKLNQQNPEMGLRMHQRLLVIIKKRLDIRTDQFRQAIMHHPDMQSLFKSKGHEYT